MAMASPRVSAQDAHARRAARQRDNSPTDGVTWGVFTPQMWGVSLLFENINRRKSLPKLFELYCTVRVFYVCVCVCVFSNRGTVWYEEKTPLSSLALSVSIGVVELMNWVLYVLHCTVPLFFPSCIAGMLTTSKLLLAWQQPGAVHNVTRECHKLWVSTVSDFGDLLRTESVPNYRMVYCMLFMKQ